MIDRVNNMDSHKPHKSKKEIRRRKRKIFFLIFLSVFIFVDFVWIMNHPYFKIDGIYISGEKTILKDDIAGSVENYLDTKILGLFPRDNILLTNTHGIENQVKNLFPKIYHADTFIKNGSELFIEIEEREPHSLWCRDESYQSDFDEECYFADQRGFIYTQAPYFSGGVFEKIYTTNELLQIGEQVLDKDEFTEFFSFTELLYQDYGISVDRIFVNNRDETRIYINSLMTSNFFYKPYIIYKNTDTYELIHRNIGIMIEHELFTKEFNEYPERLEFIDIRINDQVRYKFTPLDDFLRKQERERQEELKNETTGETNE